VRRLVRNNATKSASPYCCTAILISGVVKSAVIKMHARKWAALFHHPNQQQLGQCCFSTITNIELGQ
jgi:hypothetical protein